MERPSSERWIELCAEVSEERSRLPHSIPSDRAETHPFAYLDQDVLNAILMSEVDQHATTIGDWRKVGVPKPADTTRIIDRFSLYCENDGATTLLLHHYTHPKPWFAEARERLTYEPYDELLLRLLSAPDLPIRLPRDAIPVWLRRGMLHGIERRITRSQTVPGRLLRRTRVVAHRQNRRVKARLAKLTTEER